MANESGLIERSKALKSYLSRLLPVGTKLHLSRPLHLAGLFLAAFGSITLAWVGQLIWHDITVWGKDIAQIFFGSRTGENLSLRIGMKVIHYFLIGVALLIPGSLTVLRRQSKAIKLRLSHLLHAQPRKEKAKLGREMVKCIHLFSIV